MALEQIILIKESEAEADAIRKKSMAEAKQQLVDGEKQAAELVEQADGEAHRFYRDAMEKAREEAENAYHVTIHRMEKECNAIEMEAKSRLEGAASIIVERVVR